MLADALTSGPVHPDSTRVLAASFLVIAAAVLAILRGFDVRLCLLAAAGILGVLAARPLVVLATFARTAVDEKFIVPICSAMAFAHVLRYAGCDQHLVHLLVHPLRHVRNLLVPGGVVIGFLVNVPVISQTSTAVTIGSVLVPLLVTARLSPLTVGATLLLGSSLGGELLNPGAPELETVSSLTGAPTTDLVGRVLPLALVQLGVATTVFWAWTAWSERNSAQARKVAKEPETGVFHVNVVKALVPLLPVVFLFLVGRPLEVIRIPREWVVGARDASHFDSRLVGLAMVLGAIIAAAIAGRPLRGAVGAYRRGLVYAYVHIITLIIAANSFGKGVELIGLAAFVGRIVTGAPGLLAPTAGFLPLAFAGLCGSGMATTQSLYQFFAGPSARVGMDATRIGAIVSLGAAAGRTMSPVAAVTLMCSALTGTSPVALARRVAVPLLLGMVVVVAVGAMLARR